MKTVSIHDAKSNLSKYIAAAKKGEKVYIGGYGKPEVILTVIPKQNKKRDFSALKGTMHEYPDSFSQETEKTISDLMYGD